MDATTASERYLETFVRTAPPEKLRLLLIEKSIQRAEQATAALEKGDSHAFDEATLSLRDLLGELLAGIHPSSGELGLRVADLYVFLLQRLGIAENQHSSRELGDIRWVLLEERETWRQVCQRAEEVRMPVPAGGSVPPAAAGSLSPGVSFEA